MLKEQIDHQSSKIARSTPRRSYSLISRRMEVDGEASEQVNKRSNVLQDRISSLRVARLFVSSCPLSRGSLRVSEGPEAQSQGKQWPGIIHGGYDHDPGTLPSHGLADCRLRCGGSANCLLADITVSPPDATPARAGMGPVSLSE